MHNYPWSPGDYIAATAHLSETEDLIYRRLLDYLYMSEMSLSKDLDILIRKIRVGKNRLSTLKSVLSEFFYETDDGYRQHRADEVLSQIYEKSDKAKQSAEIRWKRNKCERNANASKPQCERNANGMLPINLLTYEPINSLTQYTITPDKPGKRVQYSSEFEYAWKEYECKGSKGAAWSVWKTLTKEEYTAATTGISIYKTLTPEKQYRKDFERYLKNRTWEDKVAAKPSDANAEENLTEWQKDCLAAMDRKTGLQK
jgi:uncharacterized protein YdaU (DUF1376 family)